MPPADTNNSLLATRVSYSNGLTTFSFIRALSTGDTTQDIDLSSPRFFVFAVNGTAVFSNGKITSVGPHPMTPIISNNRVILGTPEQCPGKREELVLILLSFSLSQVNLMSLANHRLVQR